MINGYQTLGQQILQLTRMAVLEHLTQHSTLDQSLNRQIVIGNRGPQSIPTLASNIVTRSKSSELPINRTTI